MGRPRGAFLTGFATLVFMCSTTVQASTLKTSPLSAGSDGTVQCELVNVGAVPITASIIPVSTSGGPVFDPFPCPTVAPNARCFVTIGIVPVDVFCRFTFSGSKSGVRALIETVTPGGTTTAALPAN
jgi:hypothetical protein